MFISLLINNITSNIKKKLSFYNRVLLSSTQRDIEMYIIYLLLNYYYSGLIAL